MTGDELLTLADAADRLGLAAATLRQQVRHGRLEAKLYGRTYLVSAREVARYADEHRGRRGRPPKA
jgi:excisionase family DNA binding protein